MDKSLRDQALAERLSVINPSHYEDLGALKNRLLDILDERLVQGDFLTWAKGEMEFVFLKAQMIIFNSGIRIMQPKDLAPAVAQAPTGSIFYHFIDAQRRSPICCDDFSYWLEQFGDETAEARKKISMIDPYLFSLSELRDLIVRALNKAWHKEERILSDLLSQYAEVVGEQEIRHMRALAKRLHGARVVHVNSTKSGGGVAELLNRIVPLQKELGLDVEWEIIEGKSDFFVTTKNIHNALQGAPVTLSEPMWKIYEETNRANAEMLENKLKEAGFVFIHDPQPAALINHFPQRSAKWIWRCHIDVSTPQPSVWRRLERTVSKYDASIFSLASSPKRYLIHSI